MKLRWGGILIGLLFSAVVLAQVKVSSLAQLNAGNATFVYGITNASTDGKVPVGGTNGLAYFNGSGNLVAAGNIPAAWLGTTATTALAGNTVVGSGTVTSVATTAPITGGTFTTTGTIACATCATTTNGGALSATAPASISAAGVIANGLANVTNNAQTQAAIVPNTAPSAGQILVGNAGGTAYAPVTVSGSGATITVASTGVHTISGIAAASITTGTSGANIPLLNTANTQSGAMTFSAAVTNSTNGAASVPAEIYTGTILTGGTATTNFPNILLQPTGTTAVTSWSTSGTGLGFNLASGFSGNFIDAHITGGASVFKVDNTGGATGSGVFTANGYRNTASYALTGGNKVLISATAPTIASGFGTSPSIVASNGTAAFTINVGTGGIASSGVITMPTATTGWACNVTPNAAPQAAAIMYSAPTSTTSITITNYTASTGVALAWSASAVLQVTCTGY